MAAPVDHRSTRPWLRWLTRGIVLAVAVLLALPVLPWTWTPLVVPALSPYVAAGSAIAARSVAGVTLVALPVLLLIVLRRRWFCRWACPVGLLTECAGRISPLPKTWCERLPLLGRWAALLTLAGACVGYPLLLWMDPLAMFSGLFVAWHGPLSVTGLIAASGVPAVLLISLVLPNAWCRRLCPLGATQDLVALRRRRASAAAPMPAAEGLPLARRSLLAMALGGASAAVGILAARKVLTGASSRQRRPLRPPGAVAEPQFSGLCIRCGNCIRACPAGILHADAGEQGILGFLAPIVRFDKDYCREDCGRCLEVCPTGAIPRWLLEEKWLVRTGQTSLELEQWFRRLFGGEASPAPASLTSRELENWVLQRLVERKRRAPIGLARVELELCLLTYDKECDICARVCPYEAITFTWNEEEYIRSPKVDPARCPGCGACEVACPGTNDWEREHSEVPVPLRKAIRIDADRSAAPPKVP